VVYWKRYCLLARDGQIAIGKLHLDILLGDSAERPRKRCSIDSYSTEA
jgi:hypothetical protein